MRERLRVWWWNARFRAGYRLGGFRSAMSRTLDDNIAGVRAQGGAAWDSEA